MGLRSVFFFIGVITMTLMGILNGGTLEAFFDIGSLLIVVCTTACLTLISFSVEELSEAIGNALRCTELEPGKVVKGQRIFKAMSNYALGSGAIGCLVGLVIMLGNLDDPSAIGPGMALCLITIFYALLLVVFVFIPLELSIVNRMESSEALNPSPDATGPSKGVVAGLLLTVFASTIPFLVLLVAFSTPPSSPTP